MMTRQITISHNDTHDMYDVSFERRGNATVYHIAPNVNSNVSFPRQFDIVKPDDSEQPQYETKDLNKEGREIADALWQQISLLPPQFSGGKEKV
ncbi:hypothetical protein L3C95_33800 [Chitinophaga filiformis]|uniref:hypothetical protein n=1 Tax=Chitinophaga filiformis TaxID=104663 RepID=UPI001F2C9E7E|nr:hypothetical protein [Chitinophaga filiformis]MCF6407911.1 hypothetical protein [Chitinophaga filiformis]